MDQCLRGSMIEELTAEQRWLWIGFLLLAGDSPVPGTIYRRKDADGVPIGYSNITIAEMLDVELDVYEDGIRRMIAKEKIAINEKGVISIVNWDKYQSEYQRQKKYRDGYKNNCNESYMVEGEGEREVDVEREKKRSARSRTKKPSAPTIKLILDEHPKRWENITDEDKGLWAETYPGVDVEQTLKEMIAYWDAQPASKRKINWKRTIVNRLKWLQDNGTGARGGNGKSEYRASQIGKTPPRVKTGAEAAAENAAREREKARADLRRRLFDESKTRLEAARSRGDNRAVEAITEEIDKQIQETI